MHASYLSLAFFATVGLTAPVAESTISGGTVTVNGQPFPPDSCVLDGKITPIAQCPTIPTTGLICVVNGQLLTGDACIGVPDAIDQGPVAPAVRMAKRDLTGYWFDCKGNYGPGLPKEGWKPINQACLTTDGQVVLLFYCTAAESPSIKCNKPLAIPDKAFPYPVNT